MLWIGRSLSSFWKTRSCKLRVETFCRNFFRKKLWEIAAYPLSSPHLVTADASKKESAFDWRLIKGHSTCAANPLLREHASLISCLEPNNQSICQPARTLTSQTLPCCGYLPSRGSSNDFVCSKFPFARLVVNCLWIPILPANYSDEHQGGLGRADCPSYTGVATCRNAATAFATSTINPKPLHLTNLTYPHNTKKNFQNQEIISNASNKGFPKALLTLSETCASSCRDDRNSAINIEHTWRERSKNAKQRPNLPLTIQLPTFSSTSLAES